MPANFGHCIRDDYRVPDSLTAVKFTSKNNTEGEAEVEYEVRGAVQYELSTEEVLGSAGLYTATDVVWELPATANAWWPEKRDPKEADTIQESPELSEIQDGPVWTVLTAQLIAWKTLWRCVCRKEK